MRLPTAGVDYYPVIYKLADGSVINVHIWDTCGQEIYNSICEKYYKRADGVLLVFDISNKESFEKINNYYVEKIKENCKSNIPIILLGNKTDLDENRQVSQEETIDLAVREEYIYKEASCLLNENVADAFETIIEMWNIQNKKMKQTPFGSKSKESLHMDKTRSFSLSESDHSLTIDYISKDNSNKKIQRKRKKKQSFC